MRIKDQLSPRSYGQYIHLKVLFLILLLCLTLFIALAAIVCGSYGMPIGAVLRTLAGGGSTQENVIVFNLRGPRVCTAIVAGFGLAIVGCVMQSVLRNPMASASTVGVSQGAAFGAAFAIIALGAGVESVTTSGIVNVTQPYLVSGCAFAGAMLSTFCILLLSRVQKLSASTLVLTGVALGALFSGATTMLEYFADDVRVAAVVYWTFGDLGGTYWKDIGLMLAVVLAAFVYFYFNRWNYNAIQSGEETAKGLGVNTDALLLVGMLVCAFTAAMIVSNVGLINFVGLIAPHMVRRFAGSDYRFLLPASGLAGSILLLLSDIVARMAVSPVVLPIGAITSFVGAPVFLMIIFRESKRR